MIETGEYWIDDSGQQTYADGDVGDVNHEAVAYCAALGLPMPPFDDMYDYDGPEFQVGERLVKYSPGDLGEDEYGRPIPITAQNCLYVWVKENGAPASAIKYFGRGDGTADAREYAVKWMGWIRIKIHGFGRELQSIEIDLARMDQKTLGNLRGADFWGDEWEGGVPQFVDDYEIHLNITGGPRAKTGSGRGAGRQGSADDGKYYTFPARWLFQFSDPDSLMRAVKNPQSVVAAAAEGEDPEANFSLKGLGASVDRPAPVSSVLDDVVMEYGSEEYNERAFTARLQAHPGGVTIFVIDGPAIWMGGAFYMSMLEMRRMTNGEKVERGSRDYLVISRPAERANVAVWLDAMEEQGFANSGRGLSGRWPKQPGVKVPRSKMGRQAAVENLYWRLMAEVDRLREAGNAEVNPRDSWEFHNAADELENAWNLGWIEKLYALRGGLWMPKWEELQVLAALKTTGDW